MRCLAKALLGEELLRRLKYLFAPPAARAYDNFVLTSSADRLELLRETERNPIQSR